MTPETLRCRNEINTFPPGSCPCLIRMEYTDAAMFSGTLTLFLETVQGEYQVHFPRIAAYLSRIESYTTADPEETHTGTCIREYTKSRFLDLMNGMTFTAQTEAYRHYGVYTEDTLFDIASFAEPQITKIRSKE